MRISRYFKKRQVVKAPRFRVNEFIRIPEVQVIDESGTYLGTMPATKALALARERGFDLVEVNPTQQPPVTKFLNYGQFKYEKDKEMKKQKLAVKQVAVKGVRLSVRIGKHDLEMRQNQALKFLNDGNKVKIDIILKGREKQHSNLAFEMIRDFIFSLKKQAPVKIEQPTVYQGGKISALITKE